MITLSVRTFRSHLPVQASAERRSRSLRKLGARRRATGRRWTCGWWDPRRRRSRRCDTATFRGRWRVAIPRRWTSCWSRLCCWTSCWSHLCCCWECEDRSMALRVSWDIRSCGFRCLAWKKIWRVIVLWSAQVSCKRRRFTKLKIRQKWRNTLNKSNLVTSNYSIWSADFHFYLSRRDQPNLFYDIYSTTLRL